MKVTEGVGLSCPVVDPQALWQFPAAVCRITGFLGAEESGRILDRVLSLPAADLAPSVVGPDREHQPDFRRSRTTRGLVVPRLLQAITDVLVPVAGTLGVACDESLVARYELNAHSDGDFFQEHRDITPGEDRVITFVYYLNRSPRPFTGGQLRIYDVCAAAVEDENTAESTYREWEPEHDSIIFFRPSALHEVRPVVCPTRAYADSRFAFNGWLCRPTP